MIPSGHLSSAVRNEIPQDADGPWHCQRRFDNPQMIAPADLGAVPFDDDNVHRVQSAARAVQAVDPERVAAAVNQGVFIKRAEPLIQPNADAALRLSSS